MTMSVSELIARLAEMPADAPVVVRGRPLSGVVTFRAASNVVRRRLQWIWMTETSYYAVDDDDAETPYINGVLIE
jgi:hypothetical protein